MGKLSSTWQWPVIACDVADFNMIRMVTPTTTSSPPYKKSIRGSDVDAALYYLAILLTAGELTVTCRRLLVIAYEDIGLGHPTATQRTVAAIQAAEKLGLPEASIPLGFAVIDLALSPKSNTSYRAIKSAMAAIDQGQVAPVPDHL